MRRQYVISLRPSFDLDTETAACSLDQARHDDAVHECSPEDVRLERDVGSPGAASKRGGARQCRRRPRYVKDQPSSHRDAVGRMGLEPTTQGLWVLTRCALCQPASTRW
jgi:hypothetical protein